MPFLVSADRQETFPISVKVEFDKTRHVGSWALAASPVHGSSKERPFFFFFFNQMEGEEVKTKIATWFRLELHCGKWCTLTQSLILEDRTWGKGLRCHRPGASQDPALSPASGRSTDLQESELASSSPQPSCTTCAGRGSPVYSNRREEMLQNKWNKKHVTRG